MAKGPQLYFVTWPDGKIEEASVNSYGQEHAKAGIIRTFMPEEWFGPQPWLSGAGSYFMDQVWRGMAAKGFRVQAVEVPATRELADG